MKLELKHLAPYLPYELKLYWHKDCDPVWIELQLDHVHHVIKRTNNKEALPPQDLWKPILRPLSDLTKEIKVNGEEFVAHDRTSAGMLHGRDSRGSVIIENRLRTNSITYQDMTYLISLHFDVFGLIDAGLAIDINTLEK